MKSRSERIAGVARVLALLAVLVVAAWVAWYLVGRYDGVRFEVVNQTGAAVCRVRATYDGHEVGKQRIEGGDVWVFVGDVERDGVLQVTYASCDDSTAPAVIGGGGYVTRGMPSPHRVLLSAPSREQ